MTATENSTNYKWVGTRPIRHDGFDKVVGKARFGAVIETSVGTDRLARGQWVSCPFATEAQRSLILRQGYEGHVRCRRHRSQSEEGEADTTWNVPTHKL